MSDAAAAEAKAPAPKKKLLMVLAIAGVVMAGGGAGAWFMLKGGEQKEGEAKVEEAVHKLPAQFVALDPPFVVNFEPGAAARFLQVAVQVMTRDPLIVEFLEAHEPVIRNDLLLLLGNKHVEEVSSQAGKEALRAAALEIVRKILLSEGEKPEAVEAVYFTSCVMQ